MTNKAVSTLLAAVIICASAYAVSDYTVGFSSDISNVGLYSNGFTFNPSVQGNGSGTLEVTENVQLNYIDILFYGGNGDKGAVVTADVSLAIFASVSTIAPQDVSSQAIGNVVLSWANATAIGASNGHTWIRYDFSSFELALDQDTQYAAAFIASNGYAFGSGGNYQGTGIRMISDTYLGGATISSTPAEDTRYDPIFTANFTPIPEPTTLAIFALGTLGIIRRKRTNS